MNGILPEQYLLRMREQLGENGFRSYLESMRRTPQRSIRVNTLKSGNRSFKEKVSLLRPNGISPNGYLLPENVIPSADPYHIAGLYYVQEASAQYPVAQISEVPGEDPILLDLCAAPGGKSGQLAQLLNGKGVLIANEPIESRCSVLCQNMERLGVANSIITCMQPDDICALLENACDIVVVDAPCSGEGMFRKEPAAIQNWSVQAVKACAVRQAGILKSAAKAVKKNGLLLYSTCTFSEEEDERVIDAFLSSGNDFTLLKQVRIYPHTSLGEGQFFSLMLRSSGPDGDPLLPFVKPTFGKETAVDRFLADHCPDLADKVSFVLPDGRAVLLPPLYPSNPKRWNIRCAGTIIGEIRKKDFFPSHGLYMRSDARAFAQTIEPDENDLFRFLRGETIRIDEILKGWTAVAGKGVVMGFGKADHGILKNHFPKGLRIRIGSIHRSSMLY